MKVYSQDMPSSKLIHKLSPKAKNVQSKIQKPKHQFSNSRTSSIGYRPQQYVTQSINDFQQYSLKHLVKPNQSGKKDNSTSRVSISVKRQQSIVQPGYLVRVAYAQNNSIHVENDFLALMKQHSDKQIAFVSIYGTPRAGKSFLLDTVLHLSQIFAFGNIEFQKKTNNNAVSLFTYSIPFKKNDKRIFVLDIQNFFCSQVLSVNEKLILNFMVILSSSIVVLPQPRDFGAKVLALSQLHFRERMKHILFKNQPTAVQFGYWPRDIYCLYRSFERNSIEEDERMKQLFKQFNFLIIHDAFNPGQYEQRVEFHGETSAFRNMNKKTRTLNLQYLKSVSMLFRNIFDDIRVKEFLKLKYTGKILISLSTNMVHYMNKNANSQKYDCIEMHQVFQDVMKEAYHSLYNYQLIKYNHRLERMLNNQEPKKLDQLISIFQEASSDIIQDFLFFNADKILQQKYQAKLIKNIEQKQKTLMQINEKKIKKRISKELQSSRFVFNVTDFKGQLWNLKTKFRNYDQGKTQLIGDRLKKVIADMQQNPTIQEPQQDQQKYSSMKARKEELGRMLRSQEIQQSVRKRKQAQLEEEYQQLEKNKIQLKTKIQRIEEQISKVRIQKSKGQLVKDFLSQSKEKQKQGMETAKFITNDREEKIQEMKKTVAQLKKENRKFERQIEESQMQLQFFDPNKYEDQQIKKLKRQIASLIEEQQNHEVQLLQIQNFKKNKGVPGNQTAIKNSVKTNKDAVNNSTKPQVFLSHKASIQKKDFHVTKRDIQTTSQIMKRDIKSPPNEDFSSPRVTQINSQSNLKKKPIRIVEQRDLQQDQMKNYLIKEVRAKKGRDSNLRVVK